MFFSKFPVLRYQINKLRLLRYKSCPGTEEKNPLIVTIIGGNTAEGQLTALLLKQSKVIDELRLYSGLINICGIGVDLSHIDTNSAVKAYTGQQFLKDAITDAQIVVICGGMAKKPCKKQIELFEENADYVRNIALYMGEFNPNGILCVSTPPVNAMVPMISEEMKKANAYDPRKIIGITTLSVMRANSLVAKYINKNPAEVAVPVIGGMCRRTAIAIFSQIKPCTTVEKPLAALLQEKLASAEDEALDLKYIENTGSCFVSGAFANARLVSSVIRGLKGEKKIIECAFVRQTGHIQTFLPYMASIVRLGPEGVESSHMPTINEPECQNLQKAYPLIMKRIELGTCYVNGDVPKDCRLQPRLSGACDVVKKKPVTKVGDVLLTLDEITKEKEEKCIEIIT